MANPYVHEYPPQLMVKDPKPRKKRIQARERLEQLAPPKDAAGKGPPLGPAKTASDLVFALVGPTGCDLDAVVKALETELHTVGYRLVKPIRLSELLQVEPSISRSLPKDEAKRIQKLQDAGDRVREACGDASAVAALGVLELSRVRNDEKGTRRAFLLRSLKHPQEVDLLREIYGNNLFVISVYEPRVDRILSLARRIEKSRGSKERAESDATGIIDRDEHGQVGTFGQDVRGAFPKADFFLRSGEGLRRQVTRLIEVLFGQPFRTPTPDEHGMFLARAAALLSADLSRQVGAVIVDDSDSEISSGCNEVPKFGGGIYREGDPTDHRDFAFGADPNAIIKRDILEEISKALSDSGVARVGVDKLSAVLDGSRITSLIEFGRIVHAEMNAIACAARRGIRIGGAKMYCTTFPCHVCARHILASGLREVIFIEPYPKSMALTMYADSIEMSESAAANKLVFRPFIGVAPRRYMDLFNFRKRKDADGYAIKWKPEQATPVGTTSLTEHKLKEQAVAGSIGNRLKALGWADESEDEQRTDSPPAPPGSDPVDSLGRG